MRKRHLGRALQRKPRLRAGLAQVVYVAAAYMLGRTVPKLPGFESPGPETVQLLIAVAASVVTFIGIVYSLFFLVVQFASSSFTPRLNLFRDSPIIWHAFGYFTAVFVFSITAAFTIGSDPEVTGFVPITLVILLLGLVAILNQLQEKAFSSIQLAPTLTQVTERGRRMLDDFYPDPLDDDPPIKAPPIQAPCEVRWNRDVTVVQVINVERIRHAAEQANRRVDFHVGTGESIFEGALLAEIEGPLDARLETEVFKSVTTGPDRTFEQDPTLALRLLTDIALRAVSAAINDPTTAVQALDGTESLLRHLVTRDLEVGMVEDATDTVRVVLVVPCWDDYVGLAFDELLDLSPPPSLQVRRRLDRLLDNLLAIAPPSRVAAIEARREKLAQLLGAAGDVGEAAPVHAESRP